MTIHYENFMPMYALQQHFAPPIAAPFQRFEQNMLRNYNIPTTEMRRAYDPLVNNTLRIEERLKPKLYESVLPKIDFTSKLYEPKIPELNLFPRPKLFEPTLPKIDFTHKLYEPPVFNTFDNNYLLPKKRNSFEFEEDNLFNLNRNR